MLSYGQAFYQLKEKLQSLYDAGESAAIAHMLLEHLTGLSKSDRLIKKDTLFTEKQQQQYEAALKDIVKGRPIQYITNNSWFMGREFIINESVLIPRPETEELVQWILENSKSQNLNPKIRILDIGTGSGCIPVSLKLALPKVEVNACDISNEALAVAKNNAERLGADIQFLQLDFLDFVQRNKLGKYDVIVSNPPYIPDTEKENMHTNVKDHEPAIALFVPGTDALLFYRAIADFGKEHLNTNGYIYCELEVNHAEECKALFESMGYKEVEIRKDMHGNWRMLRAGRLIG